MWVTSGLKCLRADVQSCMPPSLIPTETLAGMEVLWEKWPGTFTSMGSPDPVRNLHEQQVDLGCVKLLGLGWDLRMFVTTP